MLKLKETYNDAISEDSIGRDIEVFVCTNCNREFSVEAGGDIACCPCEFDNPDA